MHIQTSRTLLRPFEPADKHDVFEIYKNPQTCRYLLHEPWTESEHEEEFQLKLLENRLEPKAKLSLACVVGESVIGDISIWYTDMKDTVEIGYVFNPHYSAKGYASESVSALLHVLFHELKVHRVQAVMDARNTASARLCEKLGLRKEAYFKQDFWNKGEWTDSFVYGMLIEDLTN